MNRGSPQTVGATVLLMSFIPSSDAEVRLAVSQVHHADLDETDPKARAADKTVMEQSGTFASVPAPDSSLPAYVSYRVNTPGTLTPELLGGRVPNTTFLRRGCDWPHGVAAHAAPRFLLKPWESCS